MNSRFNFKLIASAALIAFVFLFQTAALAQTSRGTVSGVVTDPQGASVAGANVTLLNTQTNLSRTTTTNGEGFYRFDAVDLGTHTVTISAPGFGEVVKTGVAVSGGLTSNVDAQLAVGQQQVTIDVTADAGAILQTEAPVRGGSITTTQVTELPIASRNPALLALTLPGVTSNRFGFGVGTFSVNGARGRSNNFLLDGVENNDISVAGQGYQITNPDAVAEVAVYTSNFDAEFGRAGGAVINTITKSGTNNYHGTLSAFLDSTRDDALTLSQSRNPALALQANQPAGVVPRGRQLPGTQQIYSATLGGPLHLPRFGEGGRSIISGKDRTFFFLSWQEERQNSQQNVGLVVPTATGLSVLNAAVPSGASGNLDLYRAVIGNAVGNSSTFNVAIGARPGCAAPCNIQFGTFNRTLPFSFKDRQSILRIDHKIGENDQFSARYVFGHNEFPSAGPSFEGFDSSQVNATQNLLLQEIHVFGPSFTNDMRVGYGRILLDFPIAGSDLANTLPLFNITNLTSLGVASNLPQGRVANNYIFQDTATYIHGDHTFRFGTELLDQRSKQFAPFRGRGELSFGNSAVGATSFTGFANFIDNFGGSGSALRDFGSPAYYPFMFRQAYFFQDRWRITDSVTATLGLRYENFGTPVNSVITSAFTGLFNVNPVTRLGPFALPNETKADNNNFAPTVGIAWAPSYTSGIGGALFGEKRTVLRAGYQITYDSFFNNIASNAASSSPNIIGTTTVSTPSAALPRGLPGLTAQFPTTPRPLSPLDAQTLVIGNLVNPYYQRWSIGMQRELPMNLVLDASYVGTSGTKLYANEDLNPTVPAALRQGTPANYPTCTPGANITAAQNPTAQFPVGTLCPLSGRLDNLQGSRLIRTNGGHSIYHAAQFNLSRRFSQGLTFTAAYTWAKFIDNASDVFGVANTNLPQQAARPTILGFSTRLERGLSLFDRTHRFVMTHVYQLPWMKEQRGFAGRVLGGWEWSGVATVESGVPFTVINGQDADSIGGNLDRPDVNPGVNNNIRAVPAVATAAAGGNPCNVTVGATYYTNPDASSACIDPNTARFVGILAGSGRTGGLGRNTERTPRTVVFDMNFTKRVRIAETTHVEFRTEFFNIFNHPTPLFANPSPFTPASGSIPASVFGSVAGRFFDPRAVGTDSGGRLIRYQLKLVF
ncbi:MAG TPA: carboxypeptidase regulatory-like domain-containing protein [Pyrinomonadaceae bacterium]|nr:carboxypeptidase regulatory-like domain-containing protein [Pyrinomonadaceae bacterium]